MNLESENEKKLKDFFGNEYRSLKMYIRSRIRDSANRTAEDILQDVALKLFSGADRYGPIHNVAGFVYRSIRNKIVDVLRTSKRDDLMVLNEDILEFGDSLNESSERYTSQETEEILKTCIAQLKPPYRDIIIAVDYDGYSYKEIAQATGIPEGTLMSRRHRAIGILYKKIELELNKNKS